MKTSAPAAPALRAFGRHGFSVPALGLGAGPLGDERLEQAAAIRLVHAALDRGLTLVDTAPSYGSSEERLGEALEGRRQHVVVSTKLGYGIEGTEDWTAECIRVGVDRALSRLRTDYLDLAFFHSCPPEILRRDDVRRALGDAVEAGKVRVAGYSGDGPGLCAAKTYDVFGAFEVSHSLVDQEALREGLPEGTGVLAKRPLMNAVFAREAGKQADLVELKKRFERLPEHLREPDLEAGVAELALRFSAFSPGVHTALVGTTKVAHLEANLAALAKGPLAQETIEAIELAWDQHRWPGLI